MKLLNVGVLELVFIILLAFIVLGPQRAVKAAGDIGRWLRNLFKSPLWQDIVNTSQDLRDIPRKIMDDAEMQRTLEDIDHAIYEKKTTGDDKAEGKSG